MNLYIATMIIGSCIILLGAALHSPLLGTIGLFTAFSVFIPMILWGRK